MLIVEAQGNVRWEVPSGAPAAVPLFKTSSAFLHKNTLTFLDGEGGWSVSFTVCAVCRHMFSNSLTILLDRLKENQKEVGLSLSQRKKELICYSRLQKFAKDISVSRI